MSAAIIAGIVGVVVILDRLGVLERMKLTRPSANAAIDELNLADRKIERLEADKVDMRAKILKLEEQRTNEPVIELIANVADLCARTLEKLASFNGSLAHVEEGLGRVQESLGHATEGMKTLTGIIADLHDIPMQPQDDMRRKK